MSQHTRRRFEMLSGAPLQRHDTHSSFLDSHFFSGPAARQICPELQQCFRYARYLVVVVDEKLTSSDSSHTSRIEEFLTLEHRLLSLPFEQHLTGIEDCIRIALLLYTSVGLWNTPLYVAWVEYLVARLKIAMASLECHSRSLPYSELMLWVLFVGRYAAGAHMELEKVWFNKNLLENIAILKINKWQEARQILGGFLYVDRGFRKRFLGIWCAVLMGSGEMEDQDLYDHPCKSGRASLSVKKFLGYIQEY
jgi:hypothetical protein